MNAQKFIICVVVCFVLIFGTDYLWYEMLMADAFTDPPNMRENLNFPLIMLGVLIFCIVFCYLYPKGVEGNNKTQQGLRYGILIAFLTTVPMALINYAVYSHAPLSEYITDSVFHIVQLGVVGIVLANIHAGAMGNRGDESSGDRGDESSGDS
ncbi:MAG: DUF1761 domain-containing protein [Saprospiraceae bacterium]|jgi:Na+-driven multidrug efflux pump|nr:DUF1761 domain-containing protein [Saprospiraceae bacterium]